MKDYGSNRVFSFMMVLMILATIIYMILIENSMNTSTDNIETMQKKSQSSASNFNAVKEYKNLHEGDAVFLDSSTSLMDLDKDERMINEINDINLLDYMTNSKMKKLEYKVPTNINFHFHLTYKNVSNTLCVFLIALIITLFCVGNKE